jgi:signal transduction histidine kinase
LSRIQQIASNLVGNAIAHGGGDIEVRARSDAERLKLTVWNQDQPISPSSMVKVFDPFWRQASGRDRDGLGLGLGLYICSEIAKAQGGFLTVSSSAQEGTAFVAKLPIEGPTE